MATSTLRKVGGSLMISIPPALLEDLRLEAGTRLAVDREGDYLVLRPERPRYTLQELLDQCDFSLPRTKEDEEWLNSPPVGRELI